MQNKKKRSLKAIIILLLIVIMGVLLIKPNIELSLQLDAKNLEERVEEAYEELKEYEVLRNIAIYEKMYLEFSGIDNEYCEHVMYSQNAGLIGILGHGYFEFANNTLEDSVIKYLEVTG